MPFLCLCSAGSNDGYGGGSVVRFNLLFNAVRETAGNKTPPGASLVVKLII
jgi:hypothetical protein